MSKGARLRKEKESGDVFGGPAPVLSSYDPVEVTVPRIVFSDDVIEDQITQLAQRIRRCNLSTRVPCAQMTVSTSI